MPTFYEFFAGGGVVRACFLGHKSPIMTQRYAHHYPESLRGENKGVRPLCLTLQYVDGLSSEP